MLFIISKQFFFVLENLNDQKFGGIKLITLIGEYVSDRRLFKAESTENDVCVNHNCFLTHG